LQDFSDCQPEPQDGRFRLRYKTRLIDFRVSIMPTIYGEDANGNPAHPRAV
jgi:hypothetical protein